MPSSDCKIDLDMEGWLKSIRVFPICMFRHNNLRVVWTHVQQYVQCWHEIHSLEQLIHKQYDLHVIQWYE